MASKPTSSNTLITSKPPDQPLSIQLHPLVLLTISDYITRYTLRGLEGPLFGAVIGEQGGRTYTLEHAYECTTVDNHGEYLFDADFFTQRLEQYRTVHKEPALDLVAIFMLSPADGPQMAHIPVLQQAQKLAGNENVLMLLFHPSMVETLEGGKLPISIYEAYKEHDGQTLFWDRPFEVETGEAEMIGINYVAKGSGSLQTVSASASTAESAKSKKVKGKGKSKDEADTEVSTAPANVLSAQDDELVSALTAKLNAVKMLKQRLELIKAYLLSLPPSTLTDKSSSNQPETTNLALLRNISAMLSRLPLLTPSSSQEGEEELSSFAQASSKEHEDVQLTSLLASLTRSIADAQSLGLRFAELQRERMSKERTGPGRFTSMLSEGSMMDTGGS